MRLSWNEIRARAAHFADEWKEAHYEKGQAQTFYNEFFEVFGVTRRRVASFEEPVKKLDGKHGFIDLFWKGVCSSNRRALAEAYQGQSAGLGLFSGHQKIGTAAAHFSQ